jgi:hypothetical protein
MRLGDQDAIIPSCKNQLVRIGCCLFWSIFLSNIFCHIRGVLVYLQKKLMGNHNDDTHAHAHHEAEQNEIGGPVLFAILCFAAALVIVYFWSK